MRIAALYDIHGNLPALEAVLEEIAREDVDEVVVGGDVVPGPMPGEALARLRDLAVPVRFIRGNGEREVLAARDGAAPSGLPARVVDVIRWVAGELGDGEIADLRSWPATTRLRIDPWGDVLFCHATPGSDNEIFTRATPAERLALMFAGVDAPLVVCGHTHMQLDRDVGGLRVVNAGSVGMPFGDPAAYWLLLSPDVELRRTEYDLAAAAARVRETSYPEAQQFAANEILKPPSEADALAALEPSS